MIGRVLGLTVGIALALYAWAPIATPGKRPASLPAPVWLDPPVPHPPAPVRTWTVVAVGDVLLHGSLQRHAANHPEGMHSLWAAWEPLLTEATQAYANLEGPVAPGLTASGRQIADPGPVFDNRVYTSYPQFNYPPVLVQALVDSGIDIVSTANNHSLDRGAAGIDATIAQLRAQGLAWSGTRAQSDPTPWSPTLVERDGLRLAWIACAEHTNGLRDRMEQVQPCATDAIVEQVRAVRLAEPHAGIIITPHWGPEYAKRPTAQQQAQAKAWAIAGADVILGAHPHVPQPMQVEPGLEGHRALVVYSLGNFVSGQFHRLETQASMAVELEWEGRQGERPRVVRARVHPGAMVRERQGVRAIPAAIEPLSPALSTVFQDRFGPEPATWRPVNPPLRRTGQVNR